MDCKIKNDIGTIYITEDVLLKVVGYAALECYGIVAMSSKRAKDGIVEWLGRENLSKGVQIRSVGDMLDVDLFIIVEYGISIAEVCKTIVDTVRYKLESMTGVKVRKVNISARSLYPFTDGSFAILSASSMAATVSLFGCSSLTSKGMPPSRSDWRTKMLNAVVRFMPSSVNSASACAFKSASMRILMFVVFPAIRSTPFCWQL